MTFSHLLSVAPPPSITVNTINPEQWPPIERELGTSLPDDYKQLWAQYGHVTFFEYLGLLNPLNPKSGLIGRQREFHDWYSNQSSFVVWPASGGLLNVGADEDCHLLFWVTKGAPNEWPVVYFDDNMQVYEYYPYSLTSFLSRFLLGTYSPSFVRKNLRRRGVPPVSSVGG
jgi:hypothetical protein